MCRQLWRPYYQNTASAGIGGPNSGRREIRAIEGRPGKPNFCDGEGHRVRKSANGMVTTTCELGTKSSKRGLSSAWFASVPPGRLLLPGLFALGLPHRLPFAATRKPT